MRGEKKKNEGLEEDDGVTYWSKKTETQKRRIEKT